MSRSHPQTSHWTASACVLALALLGILGCEPKKEKRVAPPPPAYSGPRYLYGTVGSLTSFRLDRPVVVSGYGLVVGLQGTGSSDIPEVLRKPFIQDMRKKGMGSAHLGAAELGPERLLESKTAAFVVVQGLIPPGAVRGTRFDVLVTAHPATETQSLQGGRLWTADLGIAGANSTMAFVRPLAKAAGPVYINPFESEADAVKRLQTLQGRTAVVLSGGVVTESRYIELILNQPSWTRSRLIAERINERFRREPGDRNETAVAKDDALIHLYVPNRYADRVNDFLSLVQHLFLQRGIEFETKQADDLADVLVKEPAQARRVSYAWQAMGKKSWPTLQKHYRSANPVLRLNALCTGAILGDTSTSEGLMSLVSDPNPENRAQVARSLVYLPQSLKTSKALYELLDDPDKSVRIAAYESLVEAGDTNIQRRTVGERENFKFVLDLVPARTPMIYISQRELPRITVFNSNLGFKLPLLAKVWDNHLMLRGTAPDQPVSVFYQDPLSGQSQTQTIAPAVANLILLLAEKASVEKQTEGFDLTYSQVVSALYALMQQQKLEGEIELQINPLAKMIEKVVSEDKPTMRPEFERDAQAQSPIPGVPMVGVPKQPASTAPASAKALVPAPAPVPAASPVAPASQRTPAPASSETPESLP